MSDKNKYLKYKNKYLNLKKQIGGDINLIQTLIDVDISNMNLEELIELEKLVLNTRDGFCGFELDEKPIECDNLQMKRVLIKNKIDELTKS